MNFIKQPLTAKSYALVSLISLIICVALLAFFRLTLFDQPGNTMSDRTFYIVLFPLGFSAGAFLFGAMKSYASYKGNNPNGLLELGGPVVVFLLVVIGGFKLVPNSQPFNYTFHLRDRNGKTVLTSGALKVTLGNTTEQAQIGIDGSADFKNIPVDYRTLPVTVEILSDRWQFEGKKDVRECSLTGNAQSLIIQRNNSLEKVMGVVKDFVTDLSLANVSISIADRDTTTDSRGIFTIIIPEDKQADEVLLIASKPGYQNFEAYVFPSQTEKISIKLKPLTRR